MKIVCGGVRGTRCASGPDCAAFGGATMSVLAAGEAGGRVIIDAGTGLRALGARLEREGLPAQLLMLFTHYHLDHVAGLPSFGPLYRRGARILLAAPVLDGRAAADALPPLLRPPYWPVPLEAMGAAVEFRTLEAGGTPPSTAGLEVRWCPVHHPGGCAAYRIDEPATGASAVIATDVEWALSAPAERAALLTLCAEPSPARLLLFDGQFTRATYPAAEGWGHSAWEDAAEAARAAGVRRLLVIHHAPDSDDRSLEAVERDVAAALPGAGLARAGMEVSV